MPFVTGMCYNDLVDNRIQFVDEARLAELADAGDLKSLAERHPSSSLGAGTRSSTGTLPHGSAWMSARTLMIARRKLGQRVKFVASRAICEGLRIDRPTGTVAQPS